MNLVDYSDEEQIVDVPPQKRPALLVAPEVSVDHLVRKKEEERALQLSKLYDFSQEPKKNHLTGNVESFTLNDQVFAEQFHRYKTFGYVQNTDDYNHKKLVVDPTKQKDLAEMIQNGVEIEADELELKNALIGTNREDKQKKKEIKEMRVPAGDAATGLFQGPWAGYAYENFQNVELTEEQKDMLNQLELRRKQKQEEQRKKEEEFEPHMEHHARINPDSMGRPFTLPPPDLRYSDHTCYIPKRCIHTFAGHHKQVQVIRFYPKYGHLLLSGSMDHKVKMWDIMNSRECVRTYVGHTEAVKDICFTNDGRHFLTAGYDKNIVYWDTEYGKAVQQFKIKFYPLCVKVNPDPNRQNLFLCGTSNKKILQYDVNTGHRVQQYEEHLSAINTITFFNHNRKFVSSSDDKKLFVWEFGIPVVVKHISEPEMHAVNAAQLHPNGLHWVGQQNDNKIIVYETKGGNFRQNRKKIFKGHLTAGYGCQMVFSPDGQFLASGDSEGRVFFWDWKGCKNYRTLQCHDSVVISLDWHPIEPSRVATASWDGTIKLWD